MTKLINFEELHSTQKIITRAPVTDTSQLDRTAPEILESYREESVEMIVPKSHNKKKDRDEKIILKFDDGRRGELNMTVNTRKPNQKMKDSVKLEKSNKLIQQKVIAGQKPQK
jgi:hypothetical protein